MKYLSLVGLGVLALAGQCAVLAMVGGLALPGVGAAAGVAIVLVAFAQFFLRRPGELAFAGLADTFTQMNRSGDLSLRANITSEPGKACAEGFNILIETFQGIIGKVVFDAQRVAAAANELAKHARAVAEGSDQQHTAADQMSRAIVEMTAGVNAIADNAGQTAANAQEARGLSDEGVRIVGDASEEIERIARSVEQSATVIAGLGERSEAISSIVQVIKDIADQTNLLALNAAIEAARAGEQGRGFAVVADEVRKLAERTSTATNEISTMISAIQEETRAAIRSIHDGSQQAHVGAELASKAAQSLERINAGAQETMEKVDGIAAAITQQSREAENVVGHVRNIMDMVEQNRTGAAETLEEAKKLGSLADNLEEIRRVFLLGQAGEKAMRLHEEMPGMVQAAAKAIGEALERAVKQGQITEEALFSQEYKPIPNTNPQKYTSAYDSLTDRIFPPIQEPILQRSPAIVIAAAMERGCYLPTHNKHCSQPETGNYQRDFVFSRSKRIFDDPVSKRSATHNRPYLMQTYRRDTGEVMHDCSAPVYVNGRQWGGFRIAYKA